MVQEQSNMLTEIEKLKEKRRTRSFPAKEDLQRRLRQVEREVEKAIKDRKNDSSSGNNHMNRRRKKSAYEKKT